MSNFPFFVGSARSGTTLIRVIFDSHSQLAIPRESHFIPRFAKQRARYERDGSFAPEPLIADLLAHPYFQRWNFPVDELRDALSDPVVRTYPDAVRAVYARWAALKGKPRYGDKTPNYARYIPTLVSLFPDARFVHVIRDGRDVALSIRESFGKPLDRAAFEWRRSVVMAQAAGKQLGPERYLEYKHEELLDDTAGVTQRICAFLDLPFEEDMLLYHEKRPRLTDSFLEKFPHARNIERPPTKGLRDWRSQMTPDELALFERFAGDTLEQLGYERATRVAVLPRAIRKPLLKLREGLRGERVLPALRGR